MHSETHGTSAGSAEECSVSSLTAGNTTVTDKQDADNDGLYDFQLFLSQLKDPCADPILRYTKSFLHNFSSQKQQWRATEQQKLVNDFKLFIYDKFTAYEPFKSLDATRLANAKEGIEKLVMGKLYTKCFSPCLKNEAGKLDQEHQQDLDQDDQLRKKILEYKFIEPSHMEIASELSPKLDTFVKMSAGELEKINNYKAPRDKIVCVLNSCKVIFAFLKHSKLDVSGADIFLPLLIYTLIKSDVQALVSNVKYIERFRLPDFLQGESAYYLSSVQGAINYILEMDKTSLNINDVEAFELKYNQNQEQLSQSKLLNEQSQSTALAGAAPMSPSSYILRPLDEAANNLLNLVSEFLTSKSGTPIDDNSKSLGGEIDEETATRLAKNMEHKEHLQIRQNLQAMFPNIDPGVIQDVCIASKYRIGVCVDSLLSLMD
ncbi:HER234Wp [Eremothecium sinecaudum]|uniref:HER234Wp n=1 Tax=Eremothecium sinecaudum TaxID=45286 RepID=A0A109UXK7_9SACH|nr:HER234Wp [Eremothecium sinecaudum]AMD21512.1 HER234Wp [Eremothecium sinecaudum]